MRKIYLFAIFAIAVNLVFAATGFAATITSTAAGGSWSAGGSWVGGTAPGSGDDVVIVSGSTVTVTANATCNSINFFTATGSTLATLSVNAGVTLTVTNGITISNDDNTDRLAAFSGAGTINCASLQIGGTIVAPNLSADGATTLTSTIANLSISGNLSLIGVDDGADDNNPTFNLQSGSVSVGGSVVLNEPSGAAVVFSMASGVQTGTLTLSGATPFTISGSPTFTASGTGATVNYSGAAQTVDGVTYNNLILSGSGSKTTSSVTVNDTLSLQGTAAVGNAVSYGANATLEYNGSNAQNTTINEFPATMSTDVVINNALGVTLNGAKALTGNLVLENGTLVAGNNLSIGSTGTPLITRSEGAMTGTLQGTNDYDVTYTGGSKTSGPELNNGGLRNVIVNVTAGETVTLNVSPAPDGSLSVTTGILDLGAFTINRSGAGGTLTVSNGADLKIGSTNTLPSNYNTHAIGVSSTIEYDGAAQAVAALNTSQHYGNLVLSGSGAKSFASARTVDGTLSMQGTASATGTSPTFGTSATLEYAGSAAQTSTSVEFPTSNGPHNLKINNANGVTLHASRSVSGDLTMTNGAFNTAASSLITINAGGTTTGASNNSFVQGPIAKTGNTAFVFPVGSTIGSTGYHPISIGIPSVSQTFTAEYVRASGLGLDPDLNTGIYGVSNCEYWNLNRSASATVDVTLSWNANSACNGAYITTLSGLIVAFRNTVTSRWENSGGSGITNTSVSPFTTGTSLRANLSTFGAITFGNTTIGGSPLPVKLGNITGYEKQSGIQLDWTAYTESNLNRYDIERSADGITFTKVGQVIALNSLTTANYGWFDATPLTPVNFYRLKTVDMDGKTSYSSIVKVNLNKADKSITVYPNPVQNGHVSFQSSDLAKGNYTLRIFNSNGQQVYTQNFIHNGGAITQTIQLSQSIKPGMYSLLLENDGSKVMSKPFMVQ